jgi:hypothetical protein
MASLKGLHASRLVLSTPVTLDLVSLMDFVLCPFPPGSSSSEPGISDKYLQSHDLDGEPRASGVDRAFYCLLAFECSDWILSRENG